MQIKTLKIHNFRTFTDADFSFSAYSILVGANNTGKSNVIDALRIFYEKDLKDLKYQESRDFPKFKTEDKDAWIEIEYLPSKEEFTSLKDEYKLPEKTFRVRKYLQSQEKDGEGKQKSGIYAYIGGQLSDSRFYGAKNIQQGKLGDIVYIPAVSKLDDTTKLNGPSPLRDLLNTVLKQVVENSASYSSLMKSFEDFEHGLKNECTAEGQSLTKLEKDITAEISDWGTRFEVTIEPVAPDELVKTLVGHRIFDNDLGQTQESKCYGQGFQRHLIFTLIRLAAQYTAERTKPSRKEFAPEMTVILFEEPEAFLHPAQIDVLDESIRTLSTKNTIQVIISTHNPLFVSHSIADIPALTRLHKQGTRSIPYRISENDLNKIISSNQMEIQSWVSAGLPVNQDDLQTDMESIKYALWLDARRCAGFFANKVLLVEGQTEVALIDYLFHIGRLNMPKEGVFVFDSLGIFNMHRFMNLFAGLGIYHAVLYDADNQKYKAVVSSIEASKNLFTIGIDSFPKDIESFLGIPPAVQKHRKPQHIIYNVTQGIVPAKRLDELCNKIKVLLHI